MRHGNDRIENDFEPGFENDFGNNNQIHTKKDSLIVENTTDCNDLNEFQYIRNKC